MPETTTFCWGEGDPLPQLILPAERVAEEVLLHRVHRVVIARAGARARRRHGRQIGIGVIPAVSCSFRNAAEPTSSSCVTRSIVGPNVDCTSLTMSGEKFYAIGTGEPTCTRGEVASEHRRDGHDQKPQPARACQCS